MSRAGATTMGAEMANYVYAGAAPWIAASKDARTGGLYRLDTDAGRWERLTGGLPDGVEARCVAVQPDAAHIVYVGTQWGPYRSADAGKSWRQLTLPGKEQLVWSIVLHPQGPADRLCRDPRHDEMYRSVDGGERWTELSSAGAQGHGQVGLPLSRHPPRPRPQ